MNCVSHMNITYRSNAITSLVLRIIFVLNFSIRYMQSSYIFMLPRRRVGGGHINLSLSVRPFVRPDIDTWFVRLSSPTVLELQL
jgi:hypothetical protein